MNLVLLAFGDNLRNHHQACFCILSFLKEDGLHVKVVTDHPEYYEFLGDRVERIIVDEAKLLAWQGPHKFFWRIKIEAIREVLCRDGASPLIYVDSDTFLGTDLSVLKEQLRCGKAFMHLNEGKMIGFRDSTMKRMWKQCCGNAYGGVVIDKASCMWNAGVIAIPTARNMEAIDLTLKICDEMCVSGVTRKRIEQLAFSLALDRIYELSTSNDWIGHYWGNKAQWNGAITNFFTYAHLKKISIDDQVESLMAFDYQGLALIRTKRNTLKKFQRLLNRIFKLKHEVYFSGERRCCKSSQT